MEMVEKEKNLIRFAHNVISFRCDVIKACTANGIDVPTDEQIGEYINQGYGMDVNDFMADYTEHEGIFCEPITDFIKELREYGIKESDDFIKDWVSKNGYDIDKFVKESIINTIINNYEPIERLTLLATLELADVNLVVLWNEFIEESAKYGADSYIYDLRDKADVDFINKNFPNDIKAEITRINTDFNLHGKTLRFIQWHNLNDGKVYAKEDIKGIILAYWSDIFERIMLYPSAYNFNVEIYCEGDGSTYFDDVFFPIIAKEVGYIIDGDKGTIKEIEK